MKTYKVVLEPIEDGWWMASVPSVQGCRTQAKSATMAKRRIRAALALFVKDAKTAKLDFSVKLSPEMRAVLKQYKLQMELVTSHQRKAKEKLQEIVELTHGSFTLRDAADLLGLSHQWIHIMAKDAKARRAHA